MQVLNREKVKSPRQVVSAGRIRKKEVLIFFGAMLTLLLFLVVMITQYARVFQESCKLGSATTSPGVAARKLQHAAAERGKKEIQKRFMRRLGR